MEHSEDDAVHKIPQKMKTHWQNQLKLLVLVQFEIIYRIRCKKIRCYTCPMSIYPKYNIMHIEWFAED